jgi:hypothetical protein
MASQPPVHPNLNPNPQWVPPPRRRSMFGPIFLIGIGIILLLVSSGRLNGKEVAILFADYWPVLLILWGVIKLVEYMQSKREGLPAPGLGAGGVVLLIFLIVFGLAATGTRKATRNWDWNKVRDNMDITDDDFDSMFGGTKFDYTDNVEHAFPANGSLKVQVDRGQIRITPSSDDKLHIAIRKSVYSDNEAEAKKISDGFTPNITVVDNVLNVDALPRGDWKNGRIDMDIMVPKKAAVDLMTLHGAINVTDRDGEVKANGSNGDVSVESIANNVTVHMRSGSFSAKKVTGDVNLEGRGNNVNVDEVSGHLNLQGEYDEIQLGKVDKGVKFNSTRTDMEFGKLEGELNMSHGELRANSLTGPFRLTTRSKDVELEDVSGDVKIDDANGQIQVTPKAPVANIDISNKSGEVTLMMPASGNFTVDASSVRGEIESEFDLNQAQNQGHEAHYTGNVGKGGPRVQVRNDHGTIHINKR